MTRILLAMTTAIALALPAAAQTDARAHVQDILTQYGYDASQIDDLSTNDVANIYLVSTSESSFEVRRALRGLGLNRMEVDGVDMNDDTYGVVADALEMNGYDRDAIEFLSNAEVAQLYVTATSEDASDVSMEISALDIPTADEMAGMTEMPNMNDSLNRTVNDYLMRAGYSESQISGLTDGEKAEIFLLITSEMETVDADIDAIIN